jgi:lipoyl(octanoyl) transferase
MEWKITTGLTPYPQALAAMAARVEAIHKGEAEELVWFVEHPPVYTLGTSAKKADVLGAAQGPPRGRGNSCV